jgi:hypothetical protein
MKHGYKNNFLPKPFLYPLEGNYETWIQKRTLFDAFNKLLALQMRYHHFGSTSTCHSKKFNYFFPTIFVLIG